MYHTLAFTSLCPCERHDQCLVVSLQRTRYKSVLVSYRYKTATRLSLYVSIALVKYQTLLQPFLAKPATKGSTSDIFF